MTNSATAQTQSIRFTEGERRVFRIPEQISTAEWAARHRMVVDGGRKSPWRNELSPCAVGIMDALDQPYIREVYVKAAPQTVKTQAFINYLLKRIDQSPTSAMVVMPDENLQRRFFKRRLIPSIKASPRTEALLSPIMGDITRRSIAFHNGMDIVGAWAGSAAVMASDAMEFVILDEMNKYPLPTNDEPNAFDAAKQRTNSFPFTYKIYGGSTPTGEEGLITQVIKKRADEIRYYYAKCPICGEEQRMVWENISWGKSRDPREVLRKKLAHYNCRACGMQWDDSLRDRAVLATMKNGWRADEPIDRPRVVAFVLPSWYVLSMSEAVAAFLEGQDDPEKLKTWVTQHCAEEWIEKAVKRSENTILQKQSIYPAMFVPPEAVALTAGFDIQKYGFWFVVRGWAEDLTSWLIHYGYQGSTTNLKEDIETFVYKAEYKIFNSQETMKIWRAGVDTGGGESADGDWSRTEEIYQALRQLPAGAAQKVFGIKGATHIRALAAKRIKITRIDTLPNSNKTIPGGLELRLLDTSQYKGLIHFRLGRKEASSDGPAETQRFYVHQGVGIDYVKQLLSEEWRLMKGKQWGWKQTYYQNHILDCFDPKTDLLTDAGWIPCANIKSDNKCATVNLNNDKIEYQYPTNIISREHCGDMVHVKGRRIDILVTPNHRMIVNKKRFDKKTRKHIFEKTPTVVLAKDLTIWDRIKCTAMWSGDRKISKVIPSNIRSDGYISDPERVIPAQDWAEFLGWYVSEGHRSMPRCNNSHSYRIVISQKEGEKQQQIINLLNRLPWKWRIDQQRQLTISSKQLYNALDDIGLGSHNKRVPSWIKESSPEIIKIFLSAAVAGDGWTQRNFRSYATTSKLLADDMQELFLKIGMASNIKIRKAQPIKLRGPLSYNTVDQYHVTECKTKAVHLRDGKNNPNFKTIPYNGMVHCVSVPNGTLICRRSGKSFIAGNCEVISAACADAEWLPSLQMMAAYLKNKKSRAVENEQQKESSNNSGRQRSGWFGNRG